MNILSSLLTGLVVLGSIFGINLNLPTHTPSPQIQLGAFTPVQAQKFSLAGSGIDTTVTQITLSSFKLPDASTTITMAMFGAVGYATIEPGTSREESIKFTGVTQNANGTAVLTGVTRGLDFVYPYGSKSVYIKSHAGGTTLVISNTSAYYNEFAVKQSTGTISAVWTFTSSSVPQFNGEPTFTTGTQIVDKTYVDSVATSGAADANFTTKGLTQLATTSQLEQGTATTSATVYLVPSAGQFNATSTGRDVPVARPSGKLSQGWIDLTEPFTFSGGVTSTGALVQSGTSTFSGPTTLSATTTVSGGLSVTGTSTIATTTFTGAVNGTIWQQLANVSLSSPASSLSSGTFASKSSLMIYITAEAISANSNDIDLRFNGDASANYSDRTNTNNGSDDLQINQLLARMNITIGSQAGSSTAIFASINNASSTGPKAIQHNSEMYSNTTSTIYAPNHEEGYAMWYGTSSITSVTLLSSGGATFATGTRMIIYGSPN